MTFNAIEPVYQQFKGWKRDISSVKNADEMPQEMKTYIDFINKNIGANVTYISNGPGRNQIIKTEK
jgi:adenylosuccinate synthase